MRRTRVCDMSAIQVKCDVLINGSIKIMQHGKYDIERTVTENEQIRLSCN